MTSASSSKNEEDLTFSFGDTGASHTLPASMLMLLSLYERWIDFARMVMKSEWGPWLRKVAGVWACLSVVVYVAGYTCGTWVHQLNAKLTRFLVRRHDD
jgi:hypothetical protein